MTDPSAALTLRSMIALSMPLLMGFPVSEATSRGNSWRWRAGWSARRGNSPVGNGRVNASVATETGTRIRWPKARV